MAKTASAKPAEVSKKTKKPETSSSSESSSDDEAPPVKKTKTATGIAAPAPVTKKPAAKKQESSSEESSSESEDEAPKKPVAKAAAAPAAAKKPAAKKQESSSEESSSEDEAPKKPTPKRLAESSSESEEDEKPVAKKPKVDVSAPAAADASENCKIFVKGLPWKVTEYEIKDFFKGCGTIISVEIPLDETGRSSGTSYVLFSKRSELDSALELDEQIWPGTERWLKIQEARASTPRTPGTPGVKPEGCNTVFVGNLPWDVEEDQLREIFSSCGEISRVRFATNPETGEFKGFGHVEFLDGDSTDAAVLLAGTDVNGRAIRVDFAPPRNRDSFGAGGRGAGRGGASPGGRGRGGGRDFGGGRGGRGGRGAPAGGRFNANKGTIPMGAGGAGKKTTFD